MVDENNLYVRNAGVYFHWSVSWVYRSAAPVVAAVLQKLDEKNRSMQYPYELSVGIGIASGVFSDAGDMEHLLRVADGAMYEEKKRAKGLNVLTAARR